MNRTTHRVPHRRDPARHAAALRIALTAIACLSVTAAATILLPRDALGQQGSARPCTEIENDAQRLACYDSALRPARPATPAAPAAPERRATAAAPAPAPVAAAPPASAAGAAGTEIGTARTVEPRRARAARADAAPASPAAPAAPAAPDTAAADGSALVPIVIVNVRDLAGRNDKMFTTDSGTVWIQTDNARLKYPDPPFSAQIKPGMLGSSFLVMDESHRAIRVRRQD